jgi:hydrogenase expression/formation protein HypE
MEEQKIILGHGSGGRLTQELVRDVFCRHLGESGPSSLDDGAVLDFPAGRLVYTTDSYVVSPLEFPGGDIGTLCVAGTVNDLAVMGARPLWLSLGVILEAGLSFQTLEKIVQSIARTAAEAGVRIVCGDTKVVERGKGDGIYINTSGVGVLARPLAEAPVAPGDKILINGTIGDHGMTLLTLRKGFEVGTSLQSDCAPLNHLIEKVRADVDVKWMRDPTRGGVATALNELADGKQWGILLQEESLPFSEPVRGLEELLGLDPLYSANEGRVLMVVSASESDKACALLGGQAAVIGEITAEHAGRLVLNTTLNTRRTLGVLTSDPLPRIC